LYKIKLSEGSGNVNTVEIALACEYFSYFPSIYTSVKAVSNLH